MTTVGYVCVEHRETIKPDVKICGGRIYPRDEAEALARDYLRRARSVGRTETYEVLKVVRG